MNDLCMASAEELVRAFARKTLSPVEVARAVIARARKHDPAFNAMLLIDEELALAQAREAEARYARGAPISCIDGVPVTIKGLMLVKGWPVLRGSKLVDPKQSWDIEGPTPARLREAGCVFIGQTSSPEFGWKAIGDSPLTGITRNPWDVSRTPGGSSAGAAVAAAAGFGCLHVGTDGAGSIRIPASFTGIFGLKPQFGRVPLYPTSPFRSVSHAGPMTRSARDAALMMNVIQRPDDRDPSTLPFSDHNWLAGIEDGVRGLRIGFGPTLGGRANVAADIAARVDAAAKTLQAIGATVELAEPDLPDHAETELKQWSSMAAKLVAMQPQHRVHEMDPGLQAMAAIGRVWSAGDLYDVDVERIALGRAVNVYLRRYDALITPMMPVPPLPVGQDLHDPAHEKTWLDWSPFSWPFNLTGHPAASVPCGFDALGLPVGLHIVGRMHDEATVLRIARAYERAMPPVFPQLD